MSLWQFTLFLLIALLVVCHAGAEKKAKRLPLTHKLFGKKMVNQKQVDAASTYLGQENPEINMTAVSTMHVVINIPKGFKQF